MSLRSAGAAVVVAVALASPAAAQPVVVGTNAAASPAIEIIVVGSRARFGALRALLERRLAALGATSWSRAERVDAGDVLAASPAHALRCWIDLREHGRARLTFAARSGERFLLRDLELLGNAELSGDWAPSGDSDLTGDLDELDRAALAEVIELSIGALLEDERAGLSRSETKALLASRAAPGPPAAPAAGSGPLPRPSSGAQSPLVDAPAPVRQGLRFEWGLFYAAQAVAGGLPINNGPGLSLVLSKEVGPAFHRPRLFSAAWVSVQYLLPETVSGRQAGVGLDAVVTRLGLELGLWRWRLRLGAGWDFVHVQPETASASVALAPAHWTTSVAVQGAVRAHVARVAAAHLWISLFAEVIPTAVDYELAVGGNLVTVFSPWRVRPGAGLEATFP